MNPEEIKNAIDTALLAVKNISDEKLKDKTYEIVLNNLLNRSKIAHTEETSASTLEKDKKIVLPSYEALCNKFSVSREKINECFEFKNNEVEILTQISLSSNAYEQLIFTILTMTLRKIVFDERDIESSKLRESAGIKGISSLVNLSTNLKKYPTYIVHKTGKKGNTNTSYRLTIDGYNLGISIIKQILNSGKIPDILNELSENNAPAKIKRNSGLSKEIKKMIDEGFFSNFKSVNDAQIELNKRGYHNRRQDMDACIRQSYMKSQKLLLRDKKDGVWVYIIKK